MSQNNDTSESLGLADRLLASVAACEELQRTYTEALAKAKADIEAAALEVKRNPRVDGKGR